MQHRLRNLFYFNQTASAIPGVIQKARNAEQERKRLAAIERDYQAATSRFAQMDALPCVMVKGTTLYGNMEPLAIYSKPDVDAATGGRLISSYPLRVSAQKGEWVHLIGSVNGKFDMGTYKRTFIANYENVGWFPAYRFEQVSRDLCNQPQ